MYFKFLESLLFRVVIGWEMKINYMLSKYYIWLYYSYGDQLSQEYCLG